MTVEPSRYEDQTRLERLEDRRHDVFHERQPDRLAGPRRHRQIARVALAVARPDVAQWTRSGIERRLMDRDVELVAARVKDVVGPVAVMHVPVEDGNTFHA